MKKKGKVRKKFLQNNLRVCQFKKIKKHCCSKYGNCSYLKNIRCMLFDYVIRKTCKQVQ